MKDFEELTEEEQKKVIMQIGAKLTGKEIWYWEGIIHKLITLQEENEDLREENERLNNIINELTQENLKRSDKIDELLEIKNKAIEEIGLTDEDLELYNIYDVNGIELYKILKGDSSNE